MNRNNFETQWVIIRNDLQDHWNKLTDEDIDEVNGRFDNLVDKLRLRYGWTREEAETQLRNWSYSPEARSAYETRSEREEAPSYLKWALACGIPLLLLGMFYFGTHRVPEVVPQPASTVEEVTITADAPADRPLVQLIRDAIKNRGPLIQDFRNLKFSAANGVVTVSGTVQTAQDRDTIVNLIRNIPGVTSVNSNIEVRQ